MLRTSFKHSLLHRQTTATAGPDSQIQLQDATYKAHGGYKRLRQHHITRTHTLIHTMSMDRTHTRQAWLTKPPAGHIYILQSK